MTLEHYPFSKNLNYTKLEMPFGRYYLFSSFIISELHEGVHFDWEKTELMVLKLKEFYDEGVKIGFISNRINHFSVDPSNWTKIEKKYNFIRSSAIVIYNQSNFMNASIEKQFTNTPISTYRSLEEAIDDMLKQEKIS